MLISENSKKGYDDLVVLLHETIKSKRKYTVNTKNITYSKLF